MVYPSNRLAIIEPQQFWNNKGIKLFDLGRFRHSIDFFKRSIEIDSKFEDGWYWLGLSHLNLKELDKALQCFQESLNINSNSHYSWEANGVTLDLLGERKQAVKAYNSAIKLVNKLLMFNIMYKWYEKGNILLKKGAYDKAIQAYDVGMYFVPNAALPALNQDATRYGFLARDKDFCSHILEILQNKAVVDDWVEKADKAHETNNLIEAIQNYNQALALYRHHLGALYGKGRASFDSLNFREAKLAFSKVTELNPYDSVSWYWRGVVALTMKEANLNKYFDKSLKLNPSSVLANIGKGYVLFRNRKYKEALRYYEEALSQDPYNGTAWLYKAKSHTRLGQYNDALNSFNRIIKIDKTNEEALTGKKMALTKLGRKRGTTLRQ